MKGKSIAVIGGGASGICAALEAKYNDSSINVTVFERLPKTAKKILATGNGRCNFTNENLSPKHFHGDPLFLRKILTSSYADTENYFRSLGVLSYHEDGRIYPRSQQAASIREALTDKLNEYGITIKTDTPVNSIAKVMAIIIKEVKFLLIRLFLRFLRLDSCQRRRQASSSFLRLAL